MIKVLQRKISTLFIILLGALWLTGIAALNWINFKNQMNGLCTAVRSEIRKTGWHKFLETGSGGEDFEDIEYCILQIRDDGSFWFLSDHFPSMENSELINYASKVPSYNESKRLFWKVTYLYKFSKKYGSYLILISSKEALPDVLSFMTFSGVAVVVGIFFLIMAARKLSGWLIHPVEESMESEKKFMTNASHELKTPLTVIRTNIELLSDEIGDNKHLQYIEMETERMVTLINNMLTLVRLDAHYAEQTFQQFRLDESLLNVIYPMESVAYEKKIHMNVQIDEPMWFIGNENQLQSLMSILLDNAISYTPEDGRIEISACIRSRKLRLIVSNTGEPIPARQQEKLFERFYRQDEARESASNHLGLGLSIAKSIVVKHHGKIGVKSTGRKNVFHVTLPCAKK